MVTPHSSSYPANLQHLRDSPYEANRPEALMVTASQTVGATPASVYHWTAPSPPHIDIPPTAEDKSLVLPPYSGFVDQASQEDNEILQAVTQGHYAVKSREWKYESRREAQSILAFLYLGPTSAARDVNFLKEQGITLLLAIRDTTTATSGLLTGQKAAREVGISAETIDVLGNQELIRALPKAINVINTHLVNTYRSLKDTKIQSDSPDTPATWGKVLVWCESGNERSATAVAAYLMAMYNLDLVAAIQYIQTQRFSVVFDDGLKNLLFNYQQLLEARRGVLPRRDDYGTAPQVAARVKRSRDKVDDGDAMMDCEVNRNDDIERYQGRTFAPFS